MLAYLVVCNLVRIVVIISLLMLKEGGRMAKEESISVLPLSRIDLTYICSCLKLNLIVSLQCNTGEHICKALFTPKVAK